MLYEFVSYSICPKKLLKIKWIKMLDFYASHRNGKRLEQSDAQFRTAGDIGEAVVLVEELKQGEQMWISLNLVEENQSVVLATQFAAGQSTQLEIESRNRQCIGKIPFAEAVVQQVDFYRL